MAQTTAWMPLYVGDYLRDTQHLTRDESGGYLHLIMAYWAKGGPLADDPASLAAICRASLDEWQRTLNARLSPFFQIHDGFWHHKRVDAELSKATLNIEQKKRAAAASVNARRNARSTDVGLPFERNGNPSPSPSPLIGGKPPITPRPELTVIKNPSAKERVLMTPLPPQIDTPAFREAWRDWIEHRWQKRSPLTEMAAKQQVRNCAALGVERAIAKIRHSLSQGYTGLFEENSNGTHRPNSQQSADQRRADQRAKEYHDPALDVA